MKFVDPGAIDNAILQSDPFDYFVAPLFIPANALARINADYPLIESAANHDLESLKYGAAFAKFIEELTGDEVRNKIANKFDLNLDQSHTTITVRKYCEKTDGNIHTDHRSKILTVLVYFNEDWPHEGGRLRFLHSNEDIENYAAEIEPQGGTLLAFRRTDHSWHGHKQFVGERRMLQLNYLQNSMLSTIHQKVNRLSTRFQKKVLGIR